MQQGAQDIEMRLEVVPIPVSDVDAAKAFCTEQIGFHLDHDVRPNAGLRVVQMLGPEGTPGSRYLFFDDPDGNTWAVQELKRS